MIREWMAGILVLAGLAGGVGAQDKTFTDEQGRIRVNGPRVPDELRNVWPKEQEDAYWDRSQKIIQAYKGKSNPRNDGEGEKWGLPATFLAYVAGDREAALAAMQVEDNQAGTDHAHTLGIDWYWCFTIKGQTRKYFQFGDELKPEYRQRMKEGGKLWSAEDPRPGFETILLFDDLNKELHKYAAQAMEKMTGEKFGTDRDKWRSFWKQWADKGWKEFEEYERVKNVRPHPKYGVGTGPVGATWNPAVRGFWVDARNTDNLRGMRETSVYLMAEETGNELTRQIYKAKIIRTAKQFLGVGMGEWDSEGYHAHTFGAYLNLYDFAKDPEVRGCAKAILDYLSACAAVKYFHGGWGGPVKRDYGDIAPWSASAATVYPWFGAVPKDKAHEDAEQAFVITSSYRPPMAIVKLAEKKVDQPFELLNSHPAYETWLPGFDDAPEFHETMFYGRTYQLGTEAQGSRGDMNGFKLLVENAEGTADYIVAASSGKASVGNICTSTAGGDRIAQYRNLVLFLNATRPDAHFFLLLPKSATVESEGNVTFVKCHKTWLAIRSIHAGAFTATTQKPKGGDGILWMMKGIGEKAAGFALEVGEGDFAKFKADVLSKQKCDVAADGVTVELTGVTGEKVKMTATTSGLPVVWRNGNPHDWKNHVAVYQPADGGKSPISLGWKERKLRVEYGGHLFEGSLGEDGRYQFVNK